MKVKLLISRADAKRAYGVGEEVEVSEAEGLRLIQSGKAVAVDLPRETTRKRRVSETRSEG